MNILNNWILVAFLTAIIYSFAHILTKHISGRTSEYLVAWSRYFFAIPVLLLSLVIFGIPHIDPKFWPLIVILTLVEVGIAIFFVKALKVSSISKSIAFLS